MSVIAACRLSLQTRCQSMVGAFPHSITASRWMGTFGIRSVSWPQTALKRIEARANTHVTTTSSLGINSIDALTKALGTMQIATDAQQVAAKVIQPTEVHLAPPPLHPRAIHSTSFCTRPVRDGAFRIGVEKKGTQIFIHCYGHGGSGWTTLFGSISKAIHEFEKANPDKKVPIRVVGAGCMGLTMAIELHRRGYIIAGIYAAELFNTPSFGAAGYFALVSVKTSKEEQASLDAIGMDTFLTYKQIEQGKHGYLGPETVRYMPVYCSKDTKTGLEGLEAQGLIPPRKPVTLNFGNGVVRPDFYEYQTYFMNTTGLMEGLAKEVARLKIPIEIRKIDKFTDLSETVIANCTGLGARKLNNDDKMTGVRGSLVAFKRFANAASSTDGRLGHMDYMLYTEVEQDGEKEYIYLFPKDRAVTLKHPLGCEIEAVIGGTFDPDIDKLSAKEQQMHDKIQMKRLLDRNAIFFTGKSFEQIH